MNKLHLIAFLILSGIFISCSNSNEHFLKDKAYRQQVHEKFLNRKKLAMGREVELFSIFDDGNMKTDEREAMEFLYAYMPLSDLAEYDGKFYLKQVREALNTRSYFDWGKTIPDNLFRHFVLVQRVNNENLDDARGVFFEELKERVKGMTMEEAALEANHWCHEKITYRATDSRTSAPLALAKTSWGRCGEQSTFTVMALRSIGIPARQCYTPRWVHTDSNHAWVEAWIDGKWRYMGASEPEAELDAAWFTAPAKRAMMVHTRVYGDYDGPEEKTYEDDLYSIINVLDTYADTRNVEIQVVDTNNNPVKDATLKYEVYNYAQFTPIATLKTDENGISQIKTNALGDILVWAVNQDSFGYKKISADSTGFVLVIDSKLPIDTESIKMNVPGEQSIRELSAELIAVNALLLAKEDSIRNAYMATFISENQSAELAKKHGLDTEKTWKLLYKAQGNWSDVADFLIEQKDNEFVYDYLFSLSEKDLRDTSKNNLKHHLTYGRSVGVKGGVPKTMYAEYIFSPRIANEFIRPWRTFLQSKFSKKQIEEMQNNPAGIVDFVRVNIKVSDLDNYYGCPVSPQGVYELGLADGNSRDIFFVALSRALGVPARIESATSRPQYFDNGDWKDVIFEEIITGSLPKGKVRLTNNKANIIKPAYSVHYTLAKFDGKEFRTLNLRNDKALASLPGVIDVDAGQYRMTIGTRANDGSVLVENKFFEVGEGKTVTQDILLPHLDNLIQVQGTVDPNTVVVLDDNTKTSLKPLMNNKGLVLVFADPDKEPTKHILQDLPQVKEVLDSWGGGVLFMVPDDKISTAFKASAFQGLPQNTHWAIDMGREILNATSEALQLNFSNNFPLVVYINNNGGVLFSSQGYRIGIGEDIVKTIRLEEQTSK